MLAFSSSNGDVLAQTSVTTDHQGCYSAVVPVEGDTAIVPAEVGVTTSGGVTVRSPILPPPAPAP
jgi:hypothetical protein